MAQTMNRERAKRIGQAIRSRRKELKMSMKELGEAIKCSEQAVSQYERGERQVPLMALYAIAQALQCKVTDLAIIDDLNYLRERINDFKGTIPAYVFVRPEEYRAIEGLDKNIALLQEATSESNADTARFMELFELLNAEGRKRVLDYMEDIAGNTRYQK